MNRKLKIALLSFCVMLLAVLALWYPYESGRVPEWKLRIVDKRGRVAVDAQANQEWINPIDDGIVHSDSRNTDANDLVVFPGRLLQNRLALGTATTEPRSHIFVCWQGQYGEVFFDRNSPQLATQLVLKEGACPYI
jgi:hypothetical protein